MNNAVFKSKLILPIPTLQIIRQTSERKLGAQKVTPSSTLSFSLLCKFYRESKSTSLSNSDEHKGFAEIVHPNFMRLAFLLEYFFGSSQLGLEEKEGDCEIFEDGSLSSSRPRSVVATRAELLRVMSL